MMRKINLVVLTSLIVLALAACNSASAPAPVAVTPPASAAFATERAALQAGDTTTAIASLEKAIGATPGLAEAHLLLGQA
jgi:Tfp pilus assembly protein PilF